LPDDDVGTLIAFVRANFATRIKNAAMSLTNSRLCLFGASPETGNQGVNALCWSTLEGIARRVSADVQVFSYGDKQSLQVVPGSSPPSLYRLRDMSVGRRIWRANHLRRAEFSANLGWRRNPIVKDVQRADAVLDVSGGDSPLILLPQTYGPFSRGRNERTARNLIAGSSLAYARDRRSYENLQGILGHRFDPKRHRQGVDLAFGLRPRQPTVMEPALQHALERPGLRPLVGLNISGLLTNQSEAASQRFSLVSDYRELIINLIVQLLQTTDAHILLVPHVHAPTGHYESDLDACLALTRQLPQACRAEANERLTIVQSPYDASELKWIISQTDWFCGTRMHSTIAALSTGVACCALAYSLKTEGVFESCGVGNATCDLRQLSTEAALELVLSTWHHRQQLSDTLAKQLPNVLAQSDRQLDEIASTLRVAEAA
jgi:polysaccharide pyruvyl transferase WcaK-like protein